MLKIEMLNPDITKIVLEVLKEQGYLSDLVPNGSSKQPNLIKPGPKVLHIFHAGVQKLALAKKQVGLIEEKAGRSRIHTVDSARAWVCGADVKEEVDRCCNIDKMSPEGLEKILTSSDILVLPTFCFKTASRVARLMTHDIEVDIVISALVQGKKILAVNDGFRVEGVVLKPGIRKEIDQIFSKLESYGMQFCKTGDLCQTFSSLFDKKQQKKVKPKTEVVKEIRSVPEYRLITTKEIEVAVKKKQKTLRLAPKGIVTPLAEDRARENSIRIER